MTIDKIIECVSKEAAAFRRKTKKLAPAKVYDRAYDIYLIEEMVSFVCDDREKYENNENIMLVLYELSAKGKFLDEYLGWLYGLDSVDVSNIEATYNVLKEFCDYQSEEAV